MRITFWGTRGSIASAGSAMRGYGGNTACVQVVGRDGTSLILDAGTGIRPLGIATPPDVTRIDILLSHLHMDHIQGLGFFGPLFRPGLEVHIRGAAIGHARPPDPAVALSVAAALPIRLRDLASRLELHNAPEEPTWIGGLEVLSAAIIHPGATVGYRITDDDLAIAYLPDHEPALGVESFPGQPDWTSGHDLAAGVDLLVHDAQYFSVEREDRIGWGHSSAVETGRFCRARRRAAAFVLPPRPFPRRRHPRSARR